MSHPHTMPVGHIIRSKPANFGTPAMTSAPPEMIWLLCYLIAEDQHRRRYNEEREHPEWIDIGGES